MYLFMKRFIKLKCYIVSRQIIFVKKMKICPNFEF